MISGRWNFLRYSIAVCTAAAAVAFIAPLRVVAETNPAYIGQMPSVDRVKSAIQGSDATDTLARQVAAFTYLSQIVQRMKMHRSYSGAYTADEQRVMGAYDLAAYQMTQQFAKTHTADETKAFNQLHGRYEMDTQFYGEWYPRLLPASVRGAYEGGVQNDAQQAKQHYDQEKRQAEQPQAGTGVGSNGAGSNDAGTQAMKRCLELGGTQLSCLGKGMGTGLMDLIGVDLSDVKGPSHTGLVMNGRWKSQNGPVSLSFASNQVTIGGCGTLVDDNSTYTVAHKGNGVQVLIGNQAGTIALSLASAATLSGPAETNVAGQVVVGTRRVWMQHYQNGVAVPGGYWENDPIYGPKTERCAMGRLAAVQMSPQQDEGGLLGVVSQLVGEVAPQAQGPAALRMEGQYAEAGGLQLAFGPEGVILDCAQAHVKEPYTVEVTAAQVLVHIQNDASPFTLAVGLDGSLAGEGIAQVNGRLLTAATNAGPQFAATSARCAIGRMTATTAGH